MTFISFSYCRTAIPSLHRALGVLRSLLCFIAFYLVVGAVVVLWSGCSTWRKLDETEKGAIIGTGAGAAIGGASGGSTGVIIGGAAGGLAGGLIGHELEKRPERKDKDEEEED